MQFYSRFTHSTIDPKIDQSIKYAATILKSRSDKRFGDTCQKTYCHIILFKNLFKLPNLHMERFHNATCRIATDNQIQYQVVFITSRNEAIKMRKYSSNRGFMVN